MNKQPNIVSVKESKIKASLDDYEEDDEKDDEEK